MLGSNALLVAGRKMEKLALSKFWNKQVSTENPDSNNEIAADPEEGR